MLIFFKKIFKRHWFLFFLIIIVSVLSIFKISGSSIGMWNKYFYGAYYKDNNFLFGENRSIRSDEWLVGTPWIASQEKQNYPEINQSIGLGQNLTLAGVPVKNIFIFFRPHNWGYLFLNFESAFAFYWWFNAFLLIVAVYFVSMFLFNDIYLSVFISLISFFTPFFQWWGSFGIFAYGFLIFFLLLKILNFNNIRKLLFDVFFLAYFFVCFALQTYPPFQVPIVLFFIFLTIGYLFNNKKLIKNGRLKFILTGLFISIIIAVSVVFFYFYNYKDLFNIVSNTVYPGKRSVINERMLLPFLLDGFYNIQLLDEVKTVPVILNQNQSEASSFLLITVLLIPVFIIDFLIKLLKRKKTDFVYLSLIIYQLFLLIWCFFGFSDFIAKLTLMNFSSPNRSIIGFGAVNTFLIIYVLGSNFRFEKYKYQKHFFIIYSMMMFILYLFFGFFLKKNYPLFIQSDLKIIGISFIVFILTFLFLLQKKKLFLMILLVFSFFSSYRVNPLYRGLSPLINSELSVKLNAINKKDTDNSKYISYGNIAFGDYMRANGLKTLDGTYYYPDFDLWKKFDLTNKYRDIYNRYAHVSFNEPKDKLNINVAKFETSQSDCFSITIDPCSPILEKLNVNYYLFLNKVSYKCLDLIDYSAPVFIYKRRIL